MEQEYFISISIPLVFKFKNQIFFGSYLFVIKINIQTVFF